MQGDDAAVTTSAEAAHRPASGCAAAGQSAKRAAFHDGQAKRRNKEFDQTYQYKRFTCASHKC